ncbi:MAG: hypothetical protein QOG60_1658 [Frankiaceae bacterium]|nr:hypothetical protein [Frankiaceae bacterium]
MNLRRTVCLGVAAVSTVAVCGCGQSTGPSGSAGTAAPVPPSPVATSVPAERALGVFTVTCHTGSGQTASGRTDGPGLAAVDPDVLPFGSRVRIEKVGVVTAADKGGSVDRATVDVWVPSEAACTTFGRQRLQVWRLDS